MLGAQQTAERGTLSAEDPLLDEDDVLRLIDDPVLALLPWILMTITIGRLGYIAGMGIGAASAGLIVVLQIWRQEKPRIFELADLLLFLILVLIGFTGYGYLENWMNNHCDEVSNAGLMLIAFGSVWIGYPFTAEYTRFRLAPLSYRVRHRVDRLSSYAWGWAFLLATIAGGYGEWVLDDPNNFWTAWTLQTLPLIWAWLYIRWVDRRAIATVPEYADERRPWEVCVRDCAAWTVVAGLIGLVVGHETSHLLGWAFIVAGVIGMGWMTLRLRSAGGASAN